MHRIIIINKKETTYMFYEIPKRADITDYIDDSLKKISQKYKNTKLFSFGKSVLKRDLLCLKIGKGKKSIILVGAHHAMEYMTSFVLLEFAEKFLDAAENGKEMGFFSKEEFLEMYEKKCIYIIPALNPDGIDIERGNIKKGAMYDALLKMNKGSHDFSHWQANAAGVDLNHNYNAGFDKSKMLEKEYGVSVPGPTRFAGEAPESEPESMALADLTRALKFSLSSVIALHTQGEEIYYDYNGKSSCRSKLMAECFAALSGYKVSRPDGIASYGGYKDWVIDSLGIPAFTIECGKGENPLPDSDLESVYKKTEPILLSAAAF